MEAQVQAFLSFLGSQPAYSQNTCLAYRADLYALIDSLEKTLERSPELADFNPQAVRAFLEAERRRGRRGSTILRRISTYKRFEQYLIDQGLAQERVIQPDMNSIVYPIVSRAPGLPVLSPDQVNLLGALMGKSQRLSASRDHAIFALLLETGITVSTLVSLDLNDVDLRKQQLRLDVPENEGCWLPLREAYGPLDIYLSEGRPELYRVSGEPAIFISQVGTRMTRQGIWQVLKYWGKLANLPATLSPRLIRNTATLRMLDAGRPPQEMQILLGHQNMLSTRAFLHRLEKGVNGPRTTT